MPKGGLSYKSYASCVRDAAANGVSAGPCKELATGSNSGMPNSSGNNMPQPRPGSIKGYGGGNTITPQPDPRRPQGNQPMSGQMGMNPGGVVRPNARSIKGMGGNNVITPQPDPRRPQGNQVMSGQGPAGMRPGNIAGPPAQAGPRPLSKRRRRPQPNPAPMPSNFKGHY